MSAALAAPLSFRKATLDDVPVIVEIRSAAAHELGVRFGEGPWSRAATERGVSAGFRQSMVWLAFDRNEAVGTLRLTTRKPWAIDRALFTPVSRPLYLTDMAVHPTHQRRGVGTVGRQSAIQSERCAHLGRRLIVRHRAARHALEHRGDLIDEGVSQGPELLCIHGQRRTALRGTGESMASSCVEVHRDSKPQLFVVSAHHDTRRHPGTEELKVSALWWTRA